jgi:hypothetical protein
MHRRGFNAQPSKSEQSTGTHNPPLLFSPGHDYLRCVIEWLGPCCDTVSAVSTLHAHSSIHCFYTAILWQGCVWQLGDTLKYEDHFDAVNKNNDTSSVASSQYVVNYLSQDHTKKAHASLLQGVIVSMYEVVPFRTNTCQSAAGHGHMLADSTPDGVCRLLRSGQAFVMLKTPLGDTVCVPVSHLRMKVDCKVPYQTHLSSTTLPAQVTNESPFMLDLFDCLLCTIDVWQQSTWGQEVWKCCIEPNLRLMNSDHLAIHNIDGTTSACKITRSCINSGAWGHSLHRGAVMLVNCHFKLRWRNDDDSNAHHLRNVLQIGHLKRCHFCGRHAQNMESTMFAFQYQTTVDNTNNILLADSGTNLGHSIMLLFCWRAMTCMHLFTVMGCVWHMFSQ